MALSGDGSYDLRPYYRGSSVIFTYGDCTAAPNSEDRCAPPISIANYPICAENPSIRRAGDTQLKRRVKVRGLPAVAFGGTGTAFDKLELYTHRTTVEIDVGGGYRAAVALASKLRPINSRELGEALPAPVPGALDGRLKNCEASRG